MELAANMLEENGALHTLDADMYVVNALLEAGADATVRDSRRLLPVETAAAAGFAGVAVALAAFGGKAEAVKAAESAGQSEVLRALHAVADPETARTPNKAQISRNLWSGPEL